MFAMEPGNLTVGINRCIMLVTRKTANHVLLARRHSLHEALIIQFHSRKTAEVAAWEVLLQGAHVDKWVCLAVCGA